MKNVWVKDKHMNGTDVSKVPMKISRMTTFLQGLQEIKLFKSGQLSCTNMELWLQNRRISFAVYLKSKDKDMDDTINQGHIYVGDEQDLSLIHI